MATNPGLIDHRWDITFTTTPNGSGGNIGNNLRTDLGSGEAYIKNAVSSAQGGIGVANAGAAAMQGDAGRMRSQAALVNTQGNALNRDADALAALVPTLDPYRDKLGGLGDQLQGIGTSLADQAKDVFGQGSALVSLDPTKGGLSAEYIKHYGLLSPDRYVARYASDAQGAIDNARAQTERNLSRRGVNISSGANAGMIDALTRAREAALLAAAKTAGYDKGVTEQGNWVKDMTAGANTLYNMGKDTQSAATQALGAAGDMQKGAANVVTAQGGLIGDAGRLRAQAGDLFAKGASIFGDAANVEGAAANLSLSALKNLQAAQSAAAEYYLGAARVGASASGGRGVGGFTTSKAAEPAAAEPKGAFVDLTHGKASHANGAVWQWDPNAEAVPAVG